MKLIYLANVRIPTEKAHGLQIMKMVEAFKKAGTKVELVVANRLNNQLKDRDPFEYYGLDVKFPIKRIWLLDLVANNLSLKGFSVVIQNTSFAISALFYLFFKKCDIIYSRDEFSLFFLSFIKKNLVLELHTFPKSKVGLYKFLFKRMKKIVVITKQLKKLVEDLGINENKIIVSPDGVDINKFNLAETKEQCRNKLNLPLNRNIILYSGHLFAWKGVYILAESSKFLTDKELIVIVGGMDYDRDKLSKFIAKNNLKNILLIGHQPPTEIPSYLKASDILVLPNSAKKEISKFYTSPMKLFEYMASNKPIVASDLPSIREILDNDNSVLVKPDSSNDLAVGIKKLINNEQFSRTISTEALEQVKNYTWENRADSILNFIN